MIGPLAKIIRTSNSFKNVLRYFGKVWRKSNLCILWFDWFIALYSFTHIGNAKDTGEVEYLFYASYAAFQQNDANSCWFSSLNSEFVYRG